MAQRGLFYNRRMSTQSFETHVHRPKATAIAGVFVLSAIIGLTLRWFEIGGRLSFAAGLAGVVGAEIMLVVISRTYITKLQDRIIRLEMRVRGMSLLTPEQQGLLARLGIKETAALRFASDAEMPGLLARAAREKLTPADIKRAITSWTPDFDRT